MWLAPTDKRTKAYKVYNTALSAGVAALGSYAAGYFHGGAPKGNPPMSYVRRKVYRGRKRFPYRRRYRRKTRYGMRRRYRRSSGRARYLTGWGALQRRFNRKINRGLNMRMAQNDWDQCKDVHSLAELSPSVSSVSVTEQQFRVIDLPEASARLPDYDDYLIKSVQCVVTPMKIPLGDSPNIDCASGWTPSFYAVPKIHAEQWTSTPTLEQILRTNGVIEMPLTMKKKKYFNIPITLTRLDTYMTEQNGTSRTMETPLVANRFWHVSEENPPYSASSWPAFGSCVFVFPQLTASSYVPKFKVQYIVHTKLRGYKGTLDI